MDTENLVYSITDWVVHCQYGVGQIVALENKPIFDGKKGRKDFFRVLTKNGVFWFPATGIDNERVRAIATPRQFKRTLEVLQRPPQLVEAEKGELREKISVIYSNAALAPMVELARELFARNKVKNISVDEERALSKFTKQMIMEYAQIMGVEIEVARKKLHSFLRKSERDANEKFFLAY